MDDKPKIKMYDAAIKKVQKYAKTCKNLEEYCAKCVFIMHELPLEVMIEVLWTLVVAMAWEMTGERVGKGS